MASRSPTIHNVVPALKIASLRNKNVTKGLHALRTASKSLSKMDLPIERKSVVMAQMLNIENKIGDRLYLQYLFKIGARHVLSVHKSLDDEIWMSLGEIIETKEPVPLTTFYGYDKDQFEPSDKMHFEILRTKDMSKIVNYLCKIKKFFNKTNYRFKKIKVYLWFSPNTPRFTHVPEEVTDEVEDPSNAESDEPTAAEIEYSRFIFTDVPNLTVRSLSAVRNQNPEIEGILTFTEKIAALIRTVMAKDHNCQSSILGPLSIRSKNRY